MKMYELTIIGAGPAGMTAAVYAARRKIDTLLISQNLGGQPLWTGNIENYMGYQYISGPELMQKFEEQVKQFPVEQRIGDEVKSILRTGPNFRAVTDKNGSYEAKSMIIATGKRPRPLNVPGEEELRDRGVAYCAVCDAPLFAGEKVAVIGGGNAALEAVYDLVKIAEHVYLIALGQLTGDHVLVNKVKAATNVTVLLDHEILRIEGENRVRGVVIRDLKSKREEKLEVGGVFIQIGRIPNSELAKDIVKRNKANEIQVNCYCETGIPGLFAAGDVTDVPEKQIIISAGEGAKAAIQAQRYLQRL